MTFTHGLSTNNYGPAKFIVDSSAANGTHTTIASALTSASAGDTIFIRPGTYTENLTLKAGVNLVTYQGDQATPNTIISGKATFTGSGTVSISNIRLQTNSDFFLSVTGSSASIVNLYNCYLNATNNTGINFTSSNASATINCRNCIGDLGTTGIGMLSSTSAGTTSFYNCNFTNSGGSTTATTASAGVIFSSYSVFSSPVSSTSTATLDLYYSRIDTTAQNTTAVTFNGSGASGAISSDFLSGSASAISIGGSNVTLTRVSVTSSNTNAVTGAGTLNYTPVNFIGTSKVINTTTQTPLNFGSWTPTITGAAVAGTTTYTTQFGQYTIVGNLVLVEAQIVITAATGTGNATIGGLPFTVKNITNYLPVGALNIASTAWTWPASTTHIQFRPTINSTNATIGCNGSAATALLQMTNGAATFVISCWYQI